MAEEAAFLKKHIKTGSIDVHPTEKALVVNYVLEATILGEEGDRLFGNKQECQKVIRLKDLNETSDIAALAEEIVQKCKLISPDKQPEIEQLLFYLRNRKSSGKQKAAGQILDDQVDDRNSSSAGSSIIENNQRERADLINLHTYIELLYEDVPEKIKATRLIMELARNSDNLEELMQNDNLLGALTRVLREEWKKSMDFTTNILCVFLYASNFNQFHNIISHYKVGALCMQIIEYELKRYEIWREDLFGPIMLTSSKKLLNKNDDKRMMSNKNQFMTSSTVVEGASDAIEKSSNRNKLIALIKKQDQFLTVSLRLLYNLADEKDTELKMVNSGVVEIFCQILDRWPHENASADFSNTLLINLLILDVKFLKKLSVYKENVEIMVKQKIVDKLTKIMFGLPRNEEFNEISLRLLFNLSFDTRLRKKLSISNVITHVVPFVGNERLRPYALSLLYHISMDDQCKATFTYTDCIPMCMRILFEFEDEILSNNANLVDNPMEIDFSYEMIKPLDYAEFKILLALLINLALNQRNAELLSGQDGSGLKLLIEKAFKTKNCQILKLLRSISGHDGPLKLFFVEYVGDFANAVTKLDKIDKSSSSSVSKKYSNFGVECLAILSNMNIPDLNFGALLNEFHLIDWISARLKPGSIEDDVLLEIIVFLGTVAVDYSGAQLLYKCGIVDKLINILSVQQDNDDIVLQVLFVFYQTMFHETLRRKLLDETHIPSYLIELMHDKNPRIRKICDNILDLVADYGEEWAKKIQSERFRWHNAQWLETVTSSSLGGPKARRADRNLLMTNDDQQMSATINYDLDYSDDDNDLLRDDILFSGKSHTSSDEDDENSSDAIMFNAKENMTKDTLAYNRGSLE